MRRAISMARELGTAIAFVWGKVKPSADPASPGMALAHDLGLPSLTFYKLAELHGVVLGPASYVADMTADGCTAVTVELIGANGSRGVTLIVETMQMVPSAEELAGLIRRAYDRGA